MMVSSLLQPCEAVVLSVLDIAFISDRVYTNNSFYDTGELFTLQIPQLAGCSNAKFVSNYVDYPPEVKLQLN